MSEFYIKVKGVKEVEAYFNALELRMEKAMAKVAGDSAKVIQKKARKEFRSRSGGRKDPPRPPRPTLRTGNLQKSILIDGPNRVGPASYSAKVGPTILYGRRVELGYEGGGGGRGQQTTRPFPYMGPALEKSRDEIISLYHEQVRKAVTG